MAEEVFDNKQLQPERTSADGVARLDAADKSLAEALRISFVVLKIIMVVLVLLFLASGLRTVEPGEQALVLRFGKIRGAPGKKVLKPGPHWVFPYPIDRLVRIPAQETISLPIDSFWYFQTREDLLESRAKIKRRLPANLDPIKDGYCLTRGLMQSSGDERRGANDYNIVHNKWQLEYQITNPELFFRNVYVEDVKPGQRYLKVIQESINPLLISLFENAVVTAMVNYTIDEALVSQERIPRHVKDLLQAKLERVKSGITVVSVQLTEITWPRQVDEAFLYLHSASQASKKAVAEARSDAEKSLIEARGQAEAKIAQAHAHRTKVVEAARASAEYLQRILPEYRQRPKLVVHRIHLDAIQHILENADEKFIVQPVQGPGDREIRINIGRDATLKRKTDKQTHEKERQPSSASR